MMELSVIKEPRFLQHLLPGLLLTAAIAALAALLASQPLLAGLGLGALTLAIVLGVIGGNTLYPALAPVCQDGVLLAKKHLLRLGIILYGFRITLQQIADVGLSGVAIDLLVLSSTFLLTCFLGRKLLKLDRETVWLIGAGSSICGAAAILATGPVVRASSAKAAVAIATVVLFGTLAIFIYPLLWTYVQALFPALTAGDFGIYTGSTLHEVAQVVAAGHALGAETENAAVIAKMLRVMMLAPFLVLLGAWLRRDAAQQSGQRQPLTFPWFALLFILVALFNSLNLLPLRALQLINQLDNLLMAMAMTALGLTTRFSALKQAGIRPLLLGLMVFLWLMVGGGAINLLIHCFMG
ncbi:YeiH family putative sulfate export transporter [Pantoea sp.]|uniref:YeiH family protein n=1 Tax=Pantoea sp. TaxID=69393 RepID=UPI002897764E|nr:YeiH family putative sulfate export transporter [Pantoea sp.]